MYAGEGRGDTYEFYTVMIGITGTGIQNSIYVDGYREECGDTVTTIYVDGYGEDYSNAKKYGLLPALLKVLAWEVDNI